MSNLVAMDASSVPAARWPVWTGRALSGLVILFLLMDAAMKIAALTIVSESAIMIGWTGDAGFWRAMGLCCSRSPPSMPGREPRCSARSCSRAIWAAQWPRICG